ncbi:hypothetical protein METBIDRAFT_61256 [Metschnikowia bicuspidata var. bicuspidata NRRL YB-4993]|uniref:Condensin complex subunit 1 n=1 Tax=Metschnikowia bicuspidata var. bicuspidata NRRL YB-4993 TaxID=869754 RepID=A0A1A0H512_9ASCO|nr:hypothetical protein METBIDRAFT_61256 [Metschnikowia bicuspidata var. bicuspidata NRRL YB-4993]OBA19013.1 hypothetical protein METBIDRAFT_61256 [Metschnikowia bicuspidata var. bicuspidata NRRL YB-4993]
MDFNLSTFYNAFDVENDYSFETLGFESKLTSVTTSLAHSSETICTNPELLEDLIEMAHGYLHLSNPHRRQLLYLICSSFVSASHQGKNLLEQADFTDSVDQLKAELERYGYLVFVLISFLGKEDFPSSTGSLKQRQTLEKWISNCQQVEDILEAITPVLQIPLSKIFVTTPERSQFLEMFMRPIFHLMEHPDRMKVASIKILMFKNISMAVVNHSLSSVIQNSILQSLNYYVHLSTYMAELLHFLNTKFEHMALTEDLLREISLLEFNSNDSNGPKSISEFLIKLSELSPRLILKQMSSTSQLLDNSNQSLRCSVVETCGNIVVDILKSETEALETTDDLSANSALQINGLLNLLEERFLDQNPYVRTKAIQAMRKVCSLPIKIPKRRHSVMLIAVRSLGDKSTLVRRNAIKLMYKLLLSHPFSAVHGTQLDYDVWETRLKDSELELQKLIPHLSGKQKPSEELEKPLDDLGSDSGSEIDPEEFNNSIREEADLLPEPAVIIKAKLTVQYYEDALEFIRAVQNGTSIASNLLFSRNRNEVLESMDFLVLADAYGVKNAPQGIRRMLHLVWMKGSSDEGKSISSHLVDCYKELFLTAPQNATASQTAVLFAKNLISLTVSASVADLASLEKLLCLMYAAKLINPEIVKVLWLIYSKAGKNDEDYPQELTHGSIQILGMLAAANSKIVQMGMESLIRVGLGEIGKNDMLLCKYTCATILKIISLKQKLGETCDFPEEEEVLNGLAEVLLLFTEKTEWYGVAEQSLTAIFKISPNPEEVCSAALNSKAKQVFQDLSPGMPQTIALSQLLFLVGHVAIKTIEHLEKLETQFKKLKHESEGKKTGDNEEENKNELEMIGASSEDDFTDAVSFIKEAELLYDDRSILKRFGLLAQEICSNNQAYPDEGLQRSAVLCLAKLMCVSSKFCEENLPLLITIMEKSPDPIIRSNCVLGLGDMAVCFNNLVDENTDFLYGRLTDENIMVQRTCLMTVTFLILAGQVKVKGQLSSMAKCLENPDQGISDMCKLFFTELATKDNAIYNGFIDIFSGLSNDLTLEKEPMKRIIKFLVGFIEKERHQKQLADKLLVRLTKCQSETEWNDVAYVLTTIPFKNESITQALEEGFKLVLSRS